MSEVIQTIVESVKLPVKYLSLVSILFPLTTGFCYLKKHKGWHRILFIYIIGGALAELITLLSSKGHKDVFIGTLNLFTIFECVLLLVFFAAIFSQLTMKRVLYIIALFYLLWSTFSVLSNGIQISNNQITTVEALLMMMLCITTLAYLGFESQAILVWVIFLILIYFATNYITFKYDREIAQDKYLRSIIYTLQRLTNIFHNFVIGVALLQSKKNDAHS